MNFANDEKTWQFLGTDCDDQKKSYACESLLWKMIIMHQSYYHPHFGSHLTLHIFSFLRWVVLEDWDKEKKKTLWQIVP